MRPYPGVIGEEATLARALAGASLARYGDGELKLALGRDCVSQKADPRLAAELREILKAPADPSCLVCVPNLARNAKPDSWDKFREPKYLGLLGAGPYGSAFITRPDSAPWIDTAAFWADVEALWRGRPVTLVAGTERSLTAAELGAASGVREVRGPRRDAYAEIDRIEAEIGEPDHPVILCLGATATVLAWRLARKGVHAIDLGHIGMFRRHAGAYRFKASDLASPAYRAQLQRKHIERKKWGKDGHSHAPEVLAFAAAIGAETILDYGCGQGTLAGAVTPRRVQQYDPGIPGKDVLPKPSDLVVCTDVLEHIEPDRLDAVLDHIHRLAGQGVYLVIGLGPARELLPDGRNAHLIVEPPAWWLQRLAAVDWTIERSDRRKGLHVWIRK